MKTWQLENSHRDVNCSTGNTVNHIVRTAYGARVLEILGEPLWKIHDV